MKLSNFSGCRKFLEIWPIFMILVRLRDFPFLYFRHTFKAYLIFGPFFYIVCHISGLILNRKFFYRHPQNWLNSSAAFSNPEAAWWTSRKALLVSLPFDVRHQLLFLLGSGIRWNSMQQNLGANDFPASKCVTVSTQDPWLSETIDSFPEKQLKKHAASL